jgi:hypothetical protein
MDPDETAAPGIPAAGRDWRIWFGLASTVFWLWLGFLYIANTVGWTNFVAQPADALGGFLEGAFAPLAFLWLVIGFFLQQRELRTSNAAIHLQYEQMRRQAEQAEVQARAIEANELHQRQETFLMVADRVHAQLGSVTALLWMSSHGPGSENEVGEDMIADLWRRLGAGDPEAFARQVMATYYRRREEEGFVRHFFFGTPVRARHSENIRETFARLIEAGRGCDPDGIIIPALMGSAHGVVYGIISELEPAPVTSGPQAR